MLQGTFEYAEMPTHPRNRLKEFVGVRSETPPFKEIPDGHPRTPVSPDRRFGARPHRRMWRWLGRENGRPLRDQDPAAAKKQLNGEKFVTIKGKGIDKEAGGEIAVDLSFAGDTATGSIGAEGMTLKLLKAGGKSYFKADKSFFESAGAPADAVSLIGDKWVVIDANDPASPRSGLHRQEGLLEGAAQARRQGRQGQGEEGQRRRLRRAEGQGRHVLFRQEGRPAGQPGRRVQRQGHAQLLLRQGRQGRGSLVR